VLALAKRVTGLSRSKSKTADFGKAEAKAKRCPCEETVMSGYFLQKKYNECKFTNRQ